MEPRKCLERSKRRKVRLQAPFGLVFQVCEADKEPTRSQIPGSRMNAHHDTTDTIYVACEAVTAQTGKIPVIALLAYVVKLIR